MGTNFNKLLNDPKFIDLTQNAKIDFEAALIGKLIYPDHSGSQDRYFIQYIKLLQYLISFRDKTRSYFFNLRIANSEEI
jgi:hypothetical protein